MPIVVHNGVVKRLPAAGFIFAAQAFYFAQDLFPLLAGQGGAHGQIGDDGQKQVAEEKKGRISGGDFKADGFINLPHAAP